MNSSYLCNDRDLECFNALFEVESYIRLLVRWELKGNYGLSWRGVIPKEIINEAVRRQKQERDLGCVEANVFDLLSYLNLSELKELIVKSDIWEGSFKNYWGAQDIVLADFKRLIAVRNKMAHFRSITNRDFRLVKRFIEDLSYRTTNYDRMRSFSNRINISNLSVLPSKLNKNENMIELIETVNVYNGFEKYNASLFSLANHWGLELHISAGSINGEKFIKYIDNNQKMLSIFRMGELGDVFEIQFSKKIDIKSVRKLINATMELCDEVIEGISSEDAMDNYHINLREEIIPWKVNFPRSYHAS